MVPKGGGQRVMRELVVPCPTSTGHPGKEDSFKQGRKFFCGSLDLDIFLIATIDLLEHMRR